MPFSYDDWCNHYAQGCDICQGRKEISHNGVRTACYCQLKATVKFRFEQLPIVPPELKQKTWSDFTGLIRSDDKVVSSLDPSMAEKAKQAAFSYCFGSDDQSLLENRKKNLVVHKHREDGASIVIAGGRNSGRTLLASLVMKEIAAATLLFDPMITFQWVLSSNLIDATRWDNNREKDHDFLDEIGEYDFLTVDGVDIPKRGHNTPSDIVTMDRFFSKRALKKRPNILVCSLDFYTSCIDGSLRSEIENFWGTELPKLVAEDSRTVRVVLR